MPPRAMSHEQLSRYAQMRIMMLDERQRELDKKVEALELKLKEAGI
jgi:hypothetical protein